MKQQVSLGLMLFLLMPLLSGAEPSTQELDQNRRRLEEWRKHPEELQRLRKDAKAFFELPDDQRQRIARLDEDLRRQSSANQARFHKIMERYAQWLEKLEQKDRQRIQEARDHDARLAIVKELRDQEWIRHQPRALRDQLAALQVGARADFVKKLRLEERQRHLEWQIAARFWNQLQKGTPLPSRLSDFAPEVITYVTDYLRPMLSKEEEDRLEKAQGQWPRYPLTLVELADKHPPALPGPQGPKSFAELPAEVRNRLKNKFGVYPPKLLKAQGRWPEFAIAVSTFLAGKRNFIFSHELWPWGHACLSPQMQEFVDKEFDKVMDNDDKLRLIRAEGKWPEYPLAIQAIARRHNLQVPWHTLPGLRERWDNYRVTR